MTTLLYLNSTKPRNMFISEKENENSNVKVIEVAAPCSVKGEKTTY